MKKMRKWLIGFLAAVLALSLAACGEPEPKVSLDKSSASVEVGQTLTLTAAAENYAGELEWASSAVNVASVSEGKVIALSVGNAVVTVKAGSASAECAVTVTKPSVVGTLSLEYNKADILVGGTLGVRARVNYKGAEVSGLSFVWSNANPNVFSSAPNGDSVLLTGIAAGSGKLSVTTVHLGTILAEELPVTVKSDVSVGISNLAAGEDGYKLQLTNSVPNGYEGEFRREFAPEVSVTVNGAPVSAETTLRVPEDSQEIVSVDSGKITALTLGSGRVEVVYLQDTEEHVIEILVEVARPSVEKTDLFELELSPDTGIIVSPLFDGIVESVTVGGKTVSFVQTQTSVTVSGLSELEIGDNTVNVRCDNLDYQAKAFVLTKLLKTKLDLDRLGQISKVGDSKVWDGYFALGADIVYNGVFATFCGNNQGGTWGGTTGFVGVFDGRGHTIEGLRIADESHGGFLGTIGVEGIIRNVGFVNAKIDYAGASGLVSSFVYGTIENVFVEIDQHGAWSCGGIAEYVFPNAKIEHCAVFVKDSKVAHDILSLAAFSFDSALIDNCYSVGANALYRTGGDTPVAGTEKSTLKNFATYADMQAAELDLSGWGDVWDLTQGAPIFKGYKTYLSKHPEYAISNDSSEKIGETLTLTGSGEFTYSLKEAPEGISISGNVVTVSGNYSATFTVKAVYRFDETISFEETFTVMDRPVTALTGNYDFDLSKTFTVTIPELGSHAVESVTVGGKAATFVQNGTALTLSALDCPAGAQSFSIRTDASILNGTATVATSIIRTAEDWAQASAAMTENKLDGYYILAADLDYTGKTTPTLGGEVGGGVGGFVGTFDGRGYAIKGLQILDKGFFGTVGSTGVVKNLAFTDCTLIPGGSKTGVAASLVYGTIRDVYVSCANTGSWWTGGLAYYIFDPAVVENCIVEITAGNSDSFKCALTVSMQTGVKIANCYSIGALPLMTVGDGHTEFTETDSLKNFASKEDMKASGLKFDSFRNSAWDLTDGTPKFRFENLSEPA